MNNFNRGGDRGGFGGNRDGRSRFGGNRGGFGGNRDRGDRPPVTMHDAVCDECKKKCQVPFRPSGDKPVYCNDCFGGKREDRPKPSFDRAPRRDFSPRPQTQTSFGSAPRGNDDVKKQLDAMSLKLDNLIRTVEMMSMKEVKQKAKKKA